MKICSRNSVQKNSSGFFDETKSLTADSVNTTGQSHVIPKQLNGGHRIITLTKSSKKRPYKDFDLYFLGARARWPLETLPQ